ncbi:unnamed protein product [Phaeothamnion confervicola]
MSTLVRISPAAKEGWSFVLVESAYADQLYRHFRSLHLGASPVQDAVFRTVRVDRDGDGVPHVVTETMDRAFEVQATPKALTPIIGHWIKTL